MGVLIEAVEKEGEAEGDGEGKYKVGGGEEGGRHVRLDEMNDEGGCTLHVAWSSGERVAGVVVHENI